MADLLRPAEVANRLNVSSSTLRAWSQEFGPWLSPSAQGRMLDTGGHGQRRYIVDDVETLAAVKAMLESGASFDEIKRRLQEEPPAAPAEDATNTSTTTALDLPAEVRLAIVSLQQALADKDRTIGALEQTVAVQAKLISALEEQVASLKRQPAEEAPAETPVEALSTEEVPTEAPAEPLGAPVPKKSLIDRVRSRLGF